MTQNGDKNVIEVNRVLNSSSAFKTLNLPLPYLNYRQQPVWPILNREIEISFKKISVFVHPDKNKNSSNSKSAFNKLKQAFDDLTDFKKRSEIIKNYIKANTDPKLGFVPENLKNADCEELTKYFEKGRKRSKKLQLEHFDSFGNEIKKQFFVRREKAKQNNLRKKFEEEKLQKIEKKILSKVKKKKVSNGHARTVYSRLLAQSKRKNKRVC